jgi:GPH family glycoside/pentoside/hexuronide:cation symporter
MLRSAPLMAITAILVFTAPNYVTGASRLIVIFTTYLIYQFFYTMYNIPYGSLLSAMAGNDEERASLSSFRGIGSILGGIVPLVLFPLILSGFEDRLSTGYTVSITACAVTGFAACFLCYVFTEERKIINSKNAGPVKFVDSFHIIQKNRAFLALCIHGLCQGAATSITAAMSSYIYSDVYQNLKLMSMGSLLLMPVSLLFLFLVPGATRRLGLQGFIRRSLLAGIVTYATLFVMHMLFAVPLWLHVLLYALAYGLSGVSGMMQWGLLGETIDYNEYLSGKRTEGTIYGTFNMLRRIGQAVGTSAGVAMLGWFGFDAAKETLGQIQGDFTLFGIKFLCLLAPALFSLGSWLAFRFLWNITPELKAHMAECLKTIK